MRPEVGPNTPLVHRLFIAVGVLLIGSSMAVVQQAGQDRPAVSPLAVSDTLPPPKDAAQTGLGPSRMPSPAHPAVEKAFEKFGAVSGVGDDIDPDGFVVLHCARAKVADLAAWLLAHGAERVSVVALEQAFDAKNPLYDALERRIGRASPGI